MSVKNEYYVRYEIRAYRKGIEMGTQHCWNWLEADIAAEEMMKSNLYDEIRIIRLNPKEDNE